VHDSALQNKSRKIGYTAQILIALVLGVCVGILLNNLQHWHVTYAYLVDGVFDVGGKIFITILKMLVVPIVFISLVCGTCKLKDTRRFGRLALKTIVLYILTTMLAISLAVTLASAFKIGFGADLTTTSTFTAQSVPSIKESLLNIFPSNPIEAMAKGNMLQIIVFSILFGLAISWSGRAGDRVAKMFMDLDIIIMRLMHMVIAFAPFGVFCLVSSMFARIGIGLISQLIGYFTVVLFVLLLHLFLSYSLILQVIGRLNPLLFFRKMASTMLFAFSTSSSNASIPVVLNTVETKLGVHNMPASFVIPLGATINMDGTAIMQGVSTVFIANTYGIDIGLSGYLMVILTATLASIGTAGIPSVGLITLTMVLQQVGLPVEGIALIIGVDRLLDMTRTAVNISGDATIACVVAKSEDSFDINTYNDPTAN